MVQITPTNSSRRRQFDENPYYDAHNNDDAYTNHQHHNHQNQYSSVVDDDDDNWSFFPSWRTISFLTTCTIATAFCAVLAQAYIESQALSRIMAMASGLARLEQDPAVQVIRRHQQNDAGPEESWPRPRVAIGYGSCNDVFVHVSDFLAYVDDVAGGSGNTKEAVELNDIAGEADLRTSFGYYFARGAAAE